MNRSIPLNLAHVTLVGQFLHTHSVVGKSTAMLSFILNEFKRDYPIVEFFVFTKLLALVTATGKN
jgi:GTPase SAR1 family protein